jgi:hypothetical protein
VLCHERCGQQKLVMELFENVWTPADVMANKILGLSPHRLTGSVTHLQLRRLAAAQNLGGARPHRGDLGTCCSVTATCKLFFQKMPRSRQLVPATALSGCSAAS